ncbi:MAG: DsbA family protein [Anaerolineae bacterium]
MRTALLAAALVALTAVGCSPAGDAGSYSGSADGASEQAAQVVAQDASQPGSGAEGADVGGGAAGPAGGPESATSGGAAESDGSSNLGEGESADAAPGADAEATDGPEPTPDPTLQAFYSSFQPPMLGDPSAPVTILEFSDYLCPFCAVFAKDTAKKIEDEYVAKGLVSIAFIDFPIPGHGYSSVIAHEAAHCAGEQGAFWEMHLALFERQDRLEELDPSDSEAAIPVVTQIADEIGLDGSAVEACVESGIYRPIIGNLMQQAQERGINATPTLLVMSSSPDGELRNEAVLGYLPMDEFRPYIERALSHSKGTPVPSPEIPEP